MGSLLVLRTACTVARFFPRIEIIVSCSSCCVMLWIANKLLQLYELVSTWVLKVVHGWSQPHYGTSTPDLSPTSLICCIILFIFWFDFGNFLLHHVLFVITLVIVVTSLAIVVVLLYCIWWYTVLLLCLLFHLLLYSLVVLLIVLPVFMSHIVLSPDVLFYCVTRCCIA